jgi:hypothetical protein
MNKTITAPYELMRWKPWLNNSMLRQWKSLADGGNDGFLGVLSPFPMLLNRISRKLEGNLGSTLEEET